MFIKRKSSHQRWAQIVIYNEDRKIINKYDLNEKQKLKRPPRPMRRRHPLITCSIAELKNENQNKINDSQSQDCQQDISKKQEGTSEKTPIKDENMDPIEQIFGKISFDPLFDDFFVL